jgi:hypothetical protein
MSFFVQIAHSDERLDCKHGERPEALGTYIKVWLRGCLRLAQLVKRAQLS